MIDLFEKLIVQNKQHTYRIINAVLLFVAFVGTLALIINGSYIKQGYEIAVNSISDRDFFAPNDLINEIATQRLIDEARNEVSDVYNHDSSIDEAVIEEIESFFEELKSTDFEEDFSDSTAPVGITANIFISHQQYEYLMSLSVNDYEQFRTSILTITRNTLEQGIRSDTIDTTLTSVRDSIMVLQLDTTGTDTAFNIISSALQPNLIVDTEATERAKEEKAAEVEPVKVLANQKIVGEGEIVTDEIYALLDQSGYLQKNGFWENIVQITGVFTLLIVIFAFAIGYIFIEHKELYTHTNSVLLLFSLYALVTVLAYAMNSLPYVFVPVIAFTMLVAILFSAPFAFFMNLLISVITMLIYRGDLSYLIYFWLCGSIVSLTLQLANDRNKILLCGSLSSIVFAIVMVGIQMFFNIYWKNYILSYSLYAFISGILSIIVCIGSLPLLESAFGIVTDYKLQELTRSKQKLMRKLMLEAPGTYHHSLIVANLAEAAAYAIGANPTIARTGAFYHDIGKLACPMYFAENMHGSNIHDSLDPYDSAKIIIAHTTGGEELAKKYKLPPVITNIVREHHGTSLVKFFYYKQCKLAEANPDKISQPDESDFRYKDPLPSTKESALVMLADTVEAAVRSSMSKGMTEKEVDDFIKLLINDKLNDGQLKNSCLEINDLDKIRLAFLEIFKGMYHERVAYPNQNNKEK